MFLVSAGMFGAILYLPLFVQGVLGNSATNSGLVLTPLMLGFMFSSIVGGQLLSRTGRYKILAIIGFTVAAIGMFLLSRMTPATTQPEVVRNMVDHRPGYRCDDEPVHNRRSECFPLQAARRSHGQPHLLPLYWLDHGRGGDGDHHDQWVPKRDAE